MKVGKTFMGKFDGNGPLDLDLLRRLKVKRGLIFISAVSLSMKICLCRQVLEG